MSNDGRYLAWVGKLAVRIYDWQTAEVTVVKPSVKEQTLCIAFSSDSVRLVCGGNKFLCVYNLETKMSR